MADPVPCESCHAPIIFAVVHNQAGHKPARMPLNAEPDPAGNVACFRDVTGTLQGRVLSRGQHPAAHETRYMTHFATCTRPEAHRHRQRKGEAFGERTRQPGGRRPAPTPMLGYTGG